LLGYFPKCVDKSRQCFAFTPQQTFLPIILIFTEDEGNRMIHIILITSNPAHLLKSFLL
jgi:hypothetical protein